MESTLKGDRDRHVNPWDGHPNAECNSVYATKLAAVLTEYFNQHQIVPFSVLTLKGTPSYLGLPVRS